MGEWGGLVDSYQSGSWSRWVPVGGVARDQRLKFPAGRAWLCDGHGSVVCLLLILCC